MIPDYRAKINEVLSIAKNELHATTAKLSEYPVLSERFWSSLGAVIALQIQPEIGSCDLCDKS